jgi:hypothetical protein
LRGTPMSTDIRVALVFQQEEGVLALRAALANAGVVVAIECRATALDAAAILASNVDAIIVNLDPELDDLLDEVTDALDSAAQPVIFNDPSASSDLSGWDRARWMRHLSAKLKGNSDVTPPAPPGAQSIPMPRRIEVETAIAPGAAPPAELPQEPAVEVAGLDGLADAAGTEGTLLEPGDFGLADLDLLFEQAPEASSTATDAGTLTIGDDMGDLDALFSEPVAVVDLQPAAPVSQGDVGADDLDVFFAESAANAPQAESASSLADAGLSDLDELFAEQPSSEPVSTNFSEELTLSLDQGQEQALADLDMLFAEPPEPIAVASGPEPSTSPDGLTDLDALFREFENSQQAVEAATTNKPAAKAVSDEGAPEAAVAKSPFAGLSMDWSLEPVEEIAPKSTRAPEEAITEWRLDAPSKPLASKVAAAPAPVSAPKPQTGKNIPAELEASLAMADLKLVDLEDTAAPSDGLDDLGELGDLESLDLSLELDSTPSDQSRDGMQDVGDGLEMVDLDFDLELDGSPFESSSPTMPGDGLGGEPDELDALFEPVSQAPAQGLSLPDLNRIFVLGASIGGPEAIKAFLARLPANIGAAFVVAQHMGAEFLQMMASQLDAATPLAVRFPKNGERLRHGQVVVAPAGEQLSIDETGSLRLSPGSSGSPYSPSIDQLARDAADRFGDQATLILFSGMGNDAVEGGRYLTARGGQVWAQDRSSCVIASMIDSAKSQGLIRFEGTPAQLAERVLELLA